MARRFIFKSKPGKGKGKLIENPDENSVEEVKTVPNHTPVKATADTLHKNCNEVIQAPAAKKQFDKDLMGNVAGPIPEEEFLDLFLPVLHPKYSGYDRIEDADFGDVWNPSFPLEVRMYKPLAKELNTRGFNPDYVVYVASDAPEVRSGTPLRPDLGMVKKSVLLPEDRGAHEQESSVGGQGRRSHRMHLRKASSSNARAGPSKKTAAEETSANGLFNKLRRSVRTRFLTKQPNDAFSAKTPYSTPIHPFQWAHSELAIEVKRDPFHDCFEDNKDRIERPGQDAKDRRGQLASYFKEQAERQHRTHIFQVYIFGPYARFLRWDRSGVCVSAKFNYQTPKGARTLAGFFWRYCQLRDQQRGWDTSVTLANDEESEAFTELVPDMVKKKVGERINLPDYQRSFDDHPTHKLNVLFKEQKRVATLYIRRAFVPSHSPCGRATRGYIAYDPGLISSDEIPPTVYFMKDTWRTSYEGHDSEAEAYTKLSKAQVPNLPVILHAGDVLAEQGGQITETDRWLRATKSWSNFVNLNARPLKHHRLIQEIAVPLGSAKDSKSMLTVLADAAQTIVDAHDKAGILHRDISINNIMINPVTERGILNDWDHSGPAPGSDNCSGQAAGAPTRRQRGGFRTGTWQFMSVALLRDLAKVHNLNDDMESLTWVTVVAALKYLKHDDLDFDIGMFDIIRFKPVDGVKVAFGGRDKACWLYDMERTKQYKKTKWDSTPVTRLIRDLCRSYAASYLTYCIAQTDRENDSDSDLEDDSNSDPDNSEVSIADSSNCEVAGSGFAKASGFLDDDDCGIADDCSGSDVDDAQDIHSTTQVEEIFADNFMPSPHTLLKLFQDTSAMEKGWRKKKDITVPDQFPPKKAAKTERVDDAARLEWIQYSSHQVAAVSSTTINAHAPMPPMPAVARPAVLPCISPIPAAPSELLARKLNTDSSQDEGATQHEENPPPSTPTLAHQARSHNLTDGSRTIASGSRTRTLQSARSRAKAPARQGASASCNAAGEAGPSNQPMYDKSAQPQPRRVLRSNSSADRSAGTSYLHTRSRKRSRESEDHEEVEASKKKRTGRK